MPKTVTYSFELPGQIKHDFECSLNTETFELTTNGEYSAPEWARTDHRRCRHCLTAGAEYCPVALNVHNIVMPMRDVISYETVKCHVVTQERTCVLTTSAQEAIRSLMLFVIAASACPHTDFLKPLARFHLPFSSLEETVSRIVSAYLLCQYFRAEQGLPFDHALTGLRDNCENFEIIAVEMAERIRSQQMIGDAVINAIVIVHDFSLFVPLYINDHLSILKSAFVPTLRFQPPAKPNQ